jgi:hypothetical protein
MIFELRPRITVPEVRRVFVWTGDARDGMATALPQVAIRSTRRLYQPRLTKNQAFIAG